MKPIHIQQLDPIKLPLVQKLYKQFYPSAKAKKDELIFVAYCQNELSGVVRFRPVDKFRLLTGMLVAPDYRGHGIGHALMQYSKQQVLTQGDYCFAYQHLAEFYSQHGFTSIPAEALPPALRQLFSRYTSAGKKLISMKFEI